MIGPSFRAVLAAAMAGNEQAFARLWCDLQPRLLRYLRVVEANAAEDLAAETWLEVIRTLDRFDGNEQQFRSWIFTISRHRTIDWRRRAARQAVHLVPSESFSVCSAPDDPAATVVEALSSEAAVALIATLPSDQAEVLMLRVVGDLEVAQVASITGKRPGTVRVLAHRGLRRLAERLGTKLDQRDRASLGW